MVLYNDVYYECQDDQKRFTNIAPTSYSCKHGTLMFPQGKVVAVCLNGMKTLPELVFYLWFLQKN
jgi:hypothetical protein